MNKKHLILAMALPAAFAACSNEDFVSDVNSSNAQGKFVTLPSDFALVQDGEDAQTRGDWAQDTKGGRFYWMPENNGGNTYTPDKIGYAWTGVMHKADGSIDEVGSALTAYSDRVFTNYEFVHFAWRKYKEELKKDPCDGTWESGVELLQPKYFDAGWSKTREELPEFIKTDKLKEGDIDMTTGMFNTPNSTVYAGDYIVYAPYDNENVSNYIMASSKKVFNGNLYTKGNGNLWEHNDIFIYGKSSLVEGGVQTTTFTTKNLNGYVFLTLKDKDDAKDQIKKVILYDAKGRLLTKVGLSAKGIMDGKTGKDLYLADAVASRETTTTLTVNMVKNQSKYPETTKDGSSVLIPVLPTEGALDNVEIIVINDNNRAIRQKIESLTILPNDFTNVTVANIDFSNAGVLVTDEASLRYETNNQSDKEGITAGFNSNDGSKAKTVELLGDIKLTTTLAIRGNYTLQGGKIIIPGNDGEDVTGYSNAEVRMVVHAKDAAKPAVIKSDIEVEAAGCCKAFGGSLIVGNAIIEGKVTTENQTVYAGSENYVDDLSADKSKHGMVKFNVTGATTTFNGELVNNGRLDFGRSDRGANNTGTIAQLQVNVEKGSIINKNQMTIFRYEKSGQNASQLSPYVYVGNQGTFSNEGEFTIEGKWGMYGKGSNSGVIYDRVSSTVSGDLLNYNTADAKYVCDVNDPGNRFKDAVDGKSKPTTTVRFVEKSGTYDFETVTEESTSKKIVEYIVSLPTENTEENKTVTMKGDIKLSGKNIIVESGRLNFAQYSVSNKAVNSKLSVENLTIKNGGKVVIQNVSATVNKEMNVSGEAHVKDVKDFTIGKSGSKVGKLSVNAYKDNASGTYDEGYINCNLNTVTTVYGDIVNNGLINIVEATGTASDIPAYLYYTGSVQANASNWAQGVASKIND